MWLLCSSLNACYCSCTGMMSFLPVMAIPLVNASSYLKVQLCLESCFISSLLNGHPLIICSFSSCRYMPSYMSSPLSRIYMHVDMAAVMLMASMFTFMSSVSLCLLSPWFCLDSKSAMYMAGPGLYIVFGFCAEGF